MLDMVYYIYCFYFKLIIEVLLLRNKLLREELAMAYEEFIAKCTKSVNYQTNKVKYTKEGTDLLWLQSFCYIESENALVLCYTKKVSNTLVGYMKKVNYSTG